MILQSTIITELIANFTKEFPEVQVTYVETKEGLQVRMPKNFNSLPDLPRIAAFYGILELLKKFEALDVRVTLVT